MRPLWKSRAVFGTMWVLALLLGLIEARYLLKDPPWLFHMQTLLLARHPVWVRIHIAGGIVALMTGVFQFVATLRMERPRIHRVLGRIYVTAILIGGVAGLRLTPDTPLFISQALMEGRAFYLSPIGLSPAILGYSPTSTYAPSQFFLMMLGFGTLAVSWLFATAMASSASGKGA
ncbi:MAG TPA: DUF2306 domain-containing protein [Terriglobales bacterium]|nr:DUF2306 domain-containing protein [Terriglobales bacterium]